MAKQNKTQRRSISPSQFSGAEHLGLRKHASQPRLLKSQRLNENTSNSRKSNKAKKFAFSTWDKQEQVSDRKTAVRYELNQLRSENAHLRNKLQRLQAEIDKRDRSSFATTPAKRSSSISQKHVQIIQSLKATVRELKNQNSMLMSEISECKENNSQTKITKLESQLNYYKNKAIKTKQKMEPLKTQAEFYEEEIKLREFREQDLNSQILSLKQQLEDAAKVEEITQSSEVEHIKKVYRTDIAQVLKHVQFRMQLNRISKALIAKTLFGESFDKEAPITVSYLTKRFMEYPFELTKYQDSLKLSRYLLENQNNDLFTNELEIATLSLPSKEVASNMYVELDDWKPLSKELEDQYDLEIAGIISINRLTFEKACQEADKESTNQISRRQFFDIVENLELELNEHHIKYLLLLFYSFSFELDKVPYATFIESYGNFTMDEQSLEPTSQEEESTSMDVSQVKRTSKRLLKKIAAAMIEHGTEFESVFKGDKYLSTEQFVDGLEAIDLELEKKEFMVLHEYLKKDELGSIDLKFFKYQLEDAVNPQADKRNMHKSLNDISRLRDKLKNKSNKQFTSSKMQSSRPLSSSKRRLKRTDHKRTLTMTSHIPDSPVFSKQLDQVLFGKTKSTSKLLSKKRKSDGDIFEKHTFDVQTRTIFTTIDKTKQFSTADIPKSGPSKVKSERRENSKPGFATKRPSSANRYITIVKGLKSEIKELKETNSVLYEKISKAKKIQFKNSQLQQQIKIQKQDLKQQQETIEDQKTYIEKLEEGLKDLEFKHKELVFQMSLLQQQLEDQDETQQPSAAETELIKKVLRDDVQHLLKRVSYGFQLNRLPKSALAKNLFGNNFDKESIKTIQELSNRFQTTPFDIGNEQDAILLARFILEPQNSDFFTNELQIQELMLPAIEIASRLFVELDDWVTLTYETEVQFDTEICQIISAARDEFEQLAKEWDPEGTEVISLDNFEEIVEFLELELRYDHLQYLEILFYSFNFEMDKVPYMELLNSYGTFQFNENVEQIASNYESPSIQSLNPVEKSRIVHKLIQKLGKKLIKTGKKFEDVFGADSLATAEQFVDGLRELGMDAVDKKEFIALYDALRKDKAGNDDIDLDRFKMVIDGVIDPKIDRKKYLGLNDVSRLIKRDIKNKSLL